MALPEIVQRAAAAAGGPTKLAHRLGLSDDALWQWRRIPVRHIKAVAEITGLPLHELAPDLYDKPGK